MVADCARLKNEQKGPVEGGGRHCVSEICFGGNGGARARNARGRGLAKQAS